MTHRAPAAVVAPCCLGSSCPRRATLPGLRLPGVLAGTGWATGAALLGGELPARLESRTGGCEMTTMTYIGTLVVTSCPTCGIAHAIPEGLNHKAKQDHIWVFCPLGHRWHYTRTLERDLAEAKRDAEYYRGRLKDEQRAHGHTERRLTATRGVVTRTKKRIAAGVCPCCNRTFQQLARHMAGQHPEYVAEATP